MAVFSFDIWKRKAYICCIVWPVAISRKYFDFCILSFNWAKFGLLLKPCELSLQYLYHNSYCLKSKPENILKIEYEKLWNFKTEDL